MCGKLGGPVRHDPQFESLVRTHQGAVRAFLRRLTGEDALADDLAQESFIKAMGRMGELKKPESAKAWLFSIAYRTFLDSYKKTSRRARILAETPGEAPSISPAGLALDIRQAMAELTQDCRACVMLSLSEGYSHGEIAHITGLPLGTIKSHITRGKAKLKTHLQAYKHRQDKVASTYDT